MVFFQIYDVLLMLYVNEKAGIQILDDSDKQLPGDTPSEYDVKENFIYIIESVLRELEENNYRNNFTLCHVFFHFLQCKMLYFDAKFLAKKYHTTIECALYRKYKFNKILFNLTRL